MNRRKEKRERREKRRAREWEYGRGIGGEGEGEDTPVQYLFTFIEGLMELCFRFLKKTPVFSQYKATL
jgi:hypothetical protein